jgi:hypothetical protein
VSIILKMSLTIPSADARAPAIAEELELEVAEEAAFLWPKQEGCLGQLAGAEPEAREEEEPGAEEEPGEEEGPAPKVTLRPEREVDPAVLLALELELGGECG